MQMKRILHARMSSKLGWGSRHEEIVRLLSLGKIQTHQILDDSHDLRDDTTVLSLELVSLRRGAVLVDDELEVGRILPRLLDSEDRGDVVRSSSHGGGQAVGSVLGRHLRRKGDRRRGKKR